MLFTYDNDLFDSSSVQAFIKMYGDKIRFSPGIKPMITLKIKSNSEDVILKEVKEFLGK